jgi:hypothetical protein
MIISEAKRFRDQLNECIIEIDENEEINEDTQLCTYEASQYSNATNLYDPDLSSFGPEEFWEQDSGFRNTCWDAICDGPS